MVWLQERMEPKEWNMYHTRLMTPPPEVAVLPAAVSVTDEQEGRQFMSFMGAVTGGVS